MPTTKFISSSKLFEYLDHEQKEALDKAGLCELWQYGWSAVDTPDLKGIAIWDSERPWDPPSFLSAETYRCHPEWRARELTHIGDDFEGVMSLALGAIGQTLILLELNQQTPVMLPSDWFWRQQISAQLLLGIASDRLRDFFVLAYFGHRFKDHKIRKREWVDKLRERGIEDMRDYSVPFAQAAMADETGNGQALARLEVSAGKLARYRRDRNKSVHEIALKQLRAAKQRAGSNSAQPVPDKVAHVVEAAVEPGLEQAPSSVQEGVTHYLTELESAADANADWYLGLVEAADIVFYIEHALRKNCPACMFQGL